MPSRVSAIPWTCARCLRTQQRRVCSTLIPSSQFAAPSRPPARRSRHRTYSSSTRVDDGNIRLVFDSPHFWKDFSSSASHQADGRRAGLLQNKYLTGPAGFLEFTEAALARCRHLVDRILTASDVPGYKRVVRDLDALSDQLCRVIDLVEFIRNVHPDRQIQAAANRAHATMYEYMNVLNTTQGLNAQLKKAFSMSEVKDSWSEEESTAAKKLLQDFEQSVNEGAEHERQRFVELSNDVLRLGDDVMNDMAPAQQHLRIDPRRLKGMDPVMVKQRTKWKETLIPSYGGVANAALRSVEDADTRRQVYIASRQAAAGSIRNVEQMVSKRKELANLAGFESFGHMVLSDKMAQTPEAVNKFLEALAARNKPHIQNDMAELLELKKQDKHPTTAQVAQKIEAWDRSYYTQRVRARESSNNRQSEVLSQYFSLGNVMQGLSRLFDRLYGVRLVPRATVPGETWHDDVRRLDVIDEQEGHIAVLYCDLFGRAGKFANPAHFTLRCSREIDATEIAEAHRSSALPPNPSPSDLSSALNDGMAINTTNCASTSISQLPTIAFICDFARPVSSSSSTPTLLTFSNLSTLFHEMGHALHSILGRTALQNVAGTRCPTDFAELPSILMEHFAASPAVLSLFARHHETEAPLDTALLTAHLERSKRLLASQETEGQILLAALDQAYHSSEVGAPGWNSTDVYLRVFNDPRFASVTEPEGTAWQGFFGHLVGYGAVYYSYLFDRAIAGRVWKDVFEGEKSEGGGIFRGRGCGGARALDREAGQKYRDEVLRWGGARDGWSCVAGVLGQEKAWMSEGGARAMEEVGEWGAGEFGDAGAI